jgi:hypothetical protein
MQPGRGFGCGCDDFGDDFRKKKKNKHATAVEILASRVDLRAVVP